MRAAGSSVGNCAMVTSQRSTVAGILYCAAYDFRQGTRRARPELPAADPAHQEGAGRAAVRTGAEGARHRPGRSEGLPGVLPPDRPRAPGPQRRAQGIHLLHAEEVTPRFALLLALAAGPAAAADATFNVKLLTPETALKDAQAALARCRANGFQVAVAVTDRMGVVQVLLRDRFAGPHTPDMASAKAYTAVSFRTNTSELAEATQPGKPQSGIRNRPGVAAVGGGLMIEAGGSLLGAIGVSGAPGGKEDDACAAAGIAAIREDIEL